MKNIRVTYSEIGVFPSAWRARHDVTLVFVESERFIVSAVFLRLSIDTVLRSDWIFLYLTVDTGRLMSLWLTDDFADLQNEIVICVLAN